MNKINKKIIVPLIIILLLTISIFSVSKTKLITNLIYNQDYGEELELDNWELSTVFYDSTVNNGRTPLEEINWDASDSPYGTSETRTITVQITYKNTNTVTGYEPGELIMTVPNLMYNSSSSAYLNASVVASVNDSSHSGYDWSYHLPYNTNPSINNYVPSYSFRNNFAIEEKSNLEGTIQIIYTISSNTTPAQKFDTERLLTYEKDLKVVLNDQIESNEISFNFRRNITYEWIRNNYGLSTSMNKISSYDRLGTNADDYTWVKYYMYTYVSNTKDHVYLTSTYPRIVLSDFNFRVPLCEGCVARTLAGDEVTPIDGKISFNDSVSTCSWYNNCMCGARYVYFYIGYPKSIYNSANNNTNITTLFELYGTYEDRDYEEKVNEYERNINLNNYTYTPTGNLYSLSKSGTVMQEDDVYNDTSSDLIYQSIQDETGLNYITWNNTISVHHTSNLKDIEIGDDYIFATDRNGNVSELGDNDYYYSYVDIPKIKNCNSFEIEEGTYNMTLYVRYAGQNNYVEKESWGNKDKKITFDENEKVVDWYFKISNVNEGICSLSIKSRMFFEKKDIDETGTIYNYSYLKVYDKNNNILNSTSEESYNNFVKKDFLLEKDASTGYLQRAQASKKWSFYTPYYGKISQNVSKSKVKLTEDAENERFTGTYRISGTIGMGSTDSNLTPKQIVTGFFDENNFYTYIDYYDLLPKGVYLTSSEEDIIESITGGVRFLDETGEFAFSSQSQASAFFKERATVTIKENWKNTGRTLVKVNFNFEDRPLTILGYPSCWNSCAIQTYSSPITFDLNFVVSYEDFIEYGDTFVNYIYSQSPNNEATVATMDNGEKDSDAVDITEDGRTDDQIHIGSVSMTISSIISTRQEIQTAVQIDNGDFKTKKISTDYETYYNYRLRARTGQNDIKNLIIYNSLENYTKDSEQSFINAYGIKGHWQGEFIGVDTSYAENQGYNVKVWYSEEEKPGSISEDDSWQEYNDSIDKTKVKSLAFEYLDENGNRVILPANTTTYVLINMKSPTEHFKTFAYNGCWTEWNAIDPITEEPVDFITGINSNIVRVALPSSVESEDMEITLTKKWQDSSNKLDYRPENVTYHIVANGDYANAQDITFSGTGNTWTTTIEVPKYDDNGEEISYEVLEDTINLEDNYKYVSSINEYEVTNTLYKDIVITKNWLDNTNAYLTRPPNITVKVYRNGSYYKDLNITGTYNTNTWTGSLSVPVYDNTGNEYNYTVDEINIDNYSTSCENLVCTNTLTGNNNIVITKEWVDNNNSLHTRPENVTIKLKQNGNDYQNVTLTGTESTWNSETINVPKYDNNGVKYTYTVSEDTIPKYGLVEYDQEHYKVINTLKETTLLTITKIWKDNDNAYNTRPENLKITVLQNGNNYQTVTLTGTSNTWVTTLEVPKYDNNQNEYHYSIKEESNAEYSDITYSEDSLTVTNGLKKDYDLTITKIWDDNNNEYLVRPENIKVKILQNGEEYQELTINGNSNKWTKTIKVPYYDNNNKKYEYTIQEDVEVPKYGSVTYDQTTHTITNKLTEIPTVTLYFTVKTAYVDPITGELKYDEDGFNKILEKYNVKPEDEYVFTFTLKNLDTNKTYDGKLTTKGVLEFSDIPYGKYEAVQGKDELFEFVDMTSLGEVLGVSFEKVGNKGIITIKPTGQDIVFGAQLLNKIKAPIENPPTSSGIGKSILLSLGVLILFLLIMYFIKPQKRLRKI